MAVSKPWWCDRSHVHYEYATRTYSAHWGDEPPGHTHPGKGPAHDYFGRNA